MTRKNEIKEIDKQIQELQKKRNKLRYYETVENTIKLNWYKKSPPTYAIIGKTEMQLQVCYERYDNKPYLRYYRPAWNWGVKFIETEDGFKTTGPHYKHIVDVEIEPITEEHFLLANKWYV